MSIALEIILGIIGAAFFVGLLFLIGYLSKPEVRGRRGENRVSGALNQYVSQCGGYLIDDVILPYGNRTTQIDHVLFTKAGIYVIETKNWGGYIYGSQNDEYWTQVIGYKDIKHNRHYSPVRQNAVHCKAVRVHIKQYDAKIYSLIVFTQNNTEKIQANEVVNYRDMLDRMLSNKANIYSDKQLKLWYNKIKHFKDNPPMTHEQHVMSVKSDHPAPIC